MNRSPRKNRHLALVSQNPGVDGDGGNRTHATFPTSVAPHPQRWTHYVDACPACGVPPALDGYCFCKYQEVTR